MTKLTPLSYYLLFFCIIFSACAETSNESYLKNNPKNSTIMINKDTSDIKLALNAFYTGAVGFGHVYKCDVIEVIKGDFKESSFFMTILAGDLFQKQLSSTHKTDIWEVSFKFNKNDEPYFKMPISGFVDKNKTSWTITRIEKLNK